MVNMGSDCVFINIVNETQLGLAKDANCDGVLLIASVLGPALENFLNTCPVIGLETIVECHTKNEVEYALDCLCFQKKRWRQSLIQMTVKAILHGQPQ